MVAHNHGPNEGEGLACFEIRQSDGSLKGECLIQEEREVVAREILDQHWPTLKKEK